MQLHSIRPRNKLFLFIRFIGFLATFSCLSIAAKANWLRVETQNFIVYSEVKEEKTMKFLSELETYRRFLIKHGGVAPRGNALKLTIFFARSRSRYRALATSRGSVGIFNLTANGPIAMFYDTGGGHRFRQEGKQILFHEYVHYLQFQSVPTQYPLWYREGFAEYLSSVRFSEKGVSLGEILMGRAENLSRLDWIYIKQLLEAKNFLKKGAVFYAQSWLLTHMLYTSPDYRSGVSAFLDQLEENVEPKLALRQVYGYEFSKLDQDLRQYFKRGQIFAYQYPVVGSDVKILSQQKLNKAESTTADKSARLAFANGSKGYAALEKSIKKQLKKTPRNTTLNLTLIDVLIKLGKLSEAEAISRKLLSQVPDMPAAHAHLGEIVLHRAWKAQKIAKDDLPDVAKLVEARELLEIAIAKMPDNARARKWYAGSFIYGGHNDFVQAEQAISEAYGIYPQDWQIRRQYADLLFEKGDHGNACKLYRPLLRTTNSEDEQKRLKIRFDEMENCSL